LARAAAPAAAIAFAAVAPGDLGAARADATHRRWHDAAQVFC